MIAILILKIILTRRFGCCFQAAKIPTQPDLKIA